MLNFMEWLGKLEAVADPRNNLIKSKIDSEDLDSDYDYEDYDKGYGTGYRSILPQNSLFRAGKPIGKLPPGMTIIPPKKVFAKNKPQIGSYSDPYGSKTINIDNGGIKLSCTINVGEQTDTDNLAFDIFFRTPEDADKDILKNNIGKIVQFFKKSIYTKIKDTLNFYSKEKIRGFTVFVTAPYSEPFNTFGGVKDVAVSMNSIVRAAAPQMVQLGKTEKFGQNSKYFDGVIQYRKHYVIPPDLSVDWRPDNTTPEDYYAA